MCPFAHYSILKLYTFFLRNIITVQYIQLQVEWMVNIDIM